jgi:hypothetical protein
VKIPAINNLVEIIEMPSNNIGQARNELIKVADERGFDHITFQDSDDYLEPHFVEMCNKGIRQCNLPVIMFNCRLMNTDGYVDMISDEEFYEAKDNELLNNVSILSGLCIYRTKFLTLNEVWFPTKLPEPVIYEDVFFYFKLRNIISEVGYIHNIQFLYMNLKSKGRVHRRENAILHNIYQYLRDGSTYIAKQRLKINFDDERIN